MRDLSSDDNFDPAVGHVGRVVVVQSEEHDLVVSPLGVALALRGIPPKTEVVQRHDITDLDCSRVFLLGHLKASLFSVCFCLLFLQAFFDRFQKLKAEKTQG